MVAPRSSCNPIALSTAIDRPASPTLSERCDAPDLVGVLAYRPVRREPAHARGIQNTCPPPGSGVVAEVVQRTLHAPIMVEIGRHHEAIAVQDRVDERTEAFLIVRREQARRDVLQGV